jgi:hypothetical protein
MVMIPIRSDNAYVGVGQQSSQSVGVSPNYFVRWLDGSKLEFDLKTTEVWEGDGSRRLSQLIKQHQMVKMSVKFHPRPIELGFFEAAALGASADTFVAATVSTTVSAGVSAGANSIQVPANTGLTGSGTITLVVGAGSINEEVATFALPVTGAGPFTLTVASSGALKNAHSSSEVVRSYSLHTLVDTIDSPYYTVEFGLGSLNGGAGPTLRVVDCKIESVKREAKAGGILEFEVEFYGIATTLLGSPSTVAYENHNVFLYTQSKGNWTLNGSTTGDAAAVTSFSITQKNGIDTSIQAEDLLLAAMIFGNITIAVNAEIIMQNSQLIALTHFGSTSGTVDAQAIGAGDMTVGFAQADGLHKVTYRLPTMHYDKTKMPEPKKDGKHYKVSVEAKAVSNQSQNSYLLQVVLQNTKDVSY